jgi:hypothetical protein
LKFAFSFCINFRQRRILNGHQIEKATAPERAIKRRKARDLASEEVFLGLVSE